VIYPTGSNHTNAAFEGCVNIISESLNEQNCILVRQNSIVGTPQTQDNVATFSLYPNPATSQLSISNGNTPIQTIVVYNIMGAEILKISDINHSRAELTIADLQAGLYLVKVISAKNTQVKKLIIN